MQTVVSFVLASFKWFNGRVRSRGEK